MKGSDPIPSLNVVATPGFADYALLDSGAGRKLERFGKFVRAEMDKYAALVKSTQASID